MNKAESWLAESGNLRFEENKGQVRGEEGSRVRFTVKAPGIDVFILKDGIAYQYKRKHYPEEYRSLLAKGKGANKEQIARLASEIRTETFRMDALLEGANKEAEIVAEQPDAHMTHYYGGNAVGVRNYQKITFREIYPKIDWQLFFKEGKLVHEFIVHPGGDPSNIRLRYAYHQGISLQKDGSLTMKSSLGDITDQVPVSYQGGKKIATRYELKGDRMQFALANYDRSQPLLIDPTLEWATYYGGDDMEAGTSCQVDGQGNVYLAGTAASRSGIAAGGHQNTGKDLPDAFVAKFNRDGVRLWATYYSGSSGSESNVACAVDAWGNVYLGGTTNFSNGLATPGAHQTTPGGGSIDAFLVKFNDAGALQWATYYGGSGEDFGTSCAVDGSGNVYLAGFTKSFTGIAHNGFKNALEIGVNDAFLVKFNSAGVRQWGTYYGGSDWDVANYCTVDASGNVYLVGDSYSAFAMGESGHQHDPRGMGDAFLAKFNSDGQRLWGTLYGGTDTEYGGSCAIDAEGNVYLTGYTYSPSNQTNFIGTAGVHQTHHAGHADAFLVKFNSSGVRQWGAYYGGSNGDYGNYCAVDSYGYVYVVGSTQSHEGIATWGALQPSNRGGWGDAFVAKFSGTGKLQWGTYYGGEGDEFGYSCAVDPTGGVYFAGASSSTTNVATAGAHQTVYGGWEDAFLVKFSEQGCGGAPPNLDEQFVCDGTTISGLNLGAHLSWYNAATGGTPLGGSFVLQAGTYYVSQTVEGCEGPRTTVPVTVDALPVLTNATSANPTGCGLSTGSISFDINLADGWYYLQYKKNGNGTYIYVNVIAGRFTLGSLPAGVYSDFLVYNSLCSGGYSPAITLAPNCDGAPLATSGSGEWNDPSVWGNTVVPNNTNAVAIQEGSTVTMSGTAAASSLTNNGVFRGTGTFTGNITNGESGVIAPGESPGCIVVDGDYTDFGTLDIEVWGTIACSDFDQLVVTGTATLEGTLKVFIDYSPTDGDVITILDATSLSGAFTSISPALPEGWKIRYNYPSAGKVSLIYGSAPYPVNFVSFSARVQDDGSVLLNWSTAVERQNAGFFIERSTDVKVWNPIGFVEGKHDSDKLQMYSFRDTGRQGKTYYRLRQSDMDGTYSYSEVVVVNAGDHQLAVYPNPATDRLHLAGPGMYTGEIKLTVFDLLGRPVLKQSYFSQSGNGIDISTLAVGRYLVEIELSGSKTIRQLIKQ